MTVVNESWTTSRDYPYPPADVFAAWADPTVKVRWFDFSDPDSTNYCSEFRVGGRESVSTPPSQSPEFTYEAEYRDIVADQRIVITYEMAVDGRRMSVSVATVTFAATANGTRLTYVEQGAYLDGLDSVELRRGGTTTQLDRLGNVLATTH
jgi:uncharacterized protein YndB with AHSA1/START domain